MIGVKSFSVKIALRSGSRMTVLVAGRLMKPM